MGDLGRITGLETANLGFGQPVGNGHTPMLTLVLNPRIDQKCLEPAAGNGSMLENAPAVGAVALALIGVMLAGFADRRMRAALGA